MLVISNWKAYADDMGKARELFSLAKRLSARRGLRLILAPSAPIMGALAKGDRSRVAFAAQDISNSTGGAETGEATAKAYRTAGASYAIIGHSERRARGETDQTVGEKLSHALAEGLAPVLCVGEQIRDPEGKYLSGIREQLTIALTGIDPKDRLGTIIAYEPIWAIGKSASEAIEPMDLAEMVSYIRKVLAELLPGKNTARAQVLYGGSVEPENSRELAGTTGIDGFLVGHSSVDAKAFATLVKQIS